MKIQLNIVVILERVQIVTGGLEPKWPFLRTQLKDSNYIFLNGSKKNCWCLNKLTEFIDYNSDISKESVQGIGTARTREENWRWIDEVKNTDWYLRYGQIPRLLQWIYWTDFQSEMHLQMEKHWRWIDQVKNNDEYLLKTLMVIKMKLVESDAQQFLLRIMSVMRWRVKRNRISQIKTALLADFSLTQESNVWRRKLLEMERVCGNKKQHAQDERCCSYWKGSGCVGFCQGFSIRLPSPVLLYKWQLRSTIDLLVGLFYGHFSIKFHCL